MPSLCNIRIYNFLYIGDFRLTITKIVVVVVETNDDQVI